MAKTLYEILGVAPSASDGQLLAAFQRIRARLINARDEASIEALKIAREAYAILSNPSKRTLYDEKLAKRSAPAEDEPAPDGPFYLPQLYERCKERMADPFGGGPAGKQALDFSVFRQPSFLLVLAAAALALFLWFDGQEKSRRLEAQLAATQQAMAEAAAAKNEALKIREEALAEAQAELARRQQELAEKQAETNRQTIDVYRSVMTRQIDSQSGMADRNLELITPKVKAETERVGAETQRTLGEARWSQAEARNAEIAARQKEHEYNNRISRETIELARESALLGKIQQQRQDGEDGISHSNPGANH